MNVNDKVDIYFVSDSKDFKPEMKYGYLGRGCYAYVDIDSAVDYICNQPGDREIWYIYQYQICEFGLSKFNMFRGDSLNDYLSELVRNMGKLNLPREVYTKYCSMKFNNYHNLRGSDTAFCIDAEKHINSIRMYLMREVEDFNISKPRYQYVVRSDRAFSALGYVSRFEITKKEIVKNKLAGTSLYIKRRDSDMKNE